MRYDGNHEIKLRSIVDGQPALFVLHLTPPPLMAVGLSYQIIVNIRLKESSERIIACLFVTRIASNCRKMTDISNR